MMGSKEVCIHLSDAQACNGPEQDSDCYDTILMHLRVWRTPVDNSISRDYVTRAGQLISSKELHNVGPLYR